MNKHGAKQEVGLEFTDESAYREAREIAIELIDNGAKVFLYPARLAIIVVRDIQPRFDRWKGKYIEREVVGADEVSSEELKKLRRESCRIELT